MALAKSIKEILAESNGTGKNLPLALNLAHLGAQDLISFLEYVCGEVKAKDTPFDATGDATITATMKALRDTCAVLEKYRADHLLP